MRRISSKRNSNLDKPDCSASIFRHHTQNTTSIQDWCGWGDSNPHEHSSPPPQGGASTNSATSAKHYNTTNKNTFRTIQLNFIQLQASPMMFFSSHQAQANPLFHQPEEPKEQNQAHLKHFLPVHWQNKPDQS